jgi:sialic acid synthase SpsE
MKNIYIIAEMAYSHDGSVELANKIVQDAADAGADAISIHITHVPSCISKNYKTGIGRVSEGKDHKPFYEYLEEISLSFNEWKTVIKTVREANLDLVIMPNDIPSLEFSEELKPEAYVLSAASFEEYDFIKSVGLQNKPVYLRVGGATLGEIETTIKLLNKSGNQQITLLYGHQNYPTEIEDTNLAFLPYLKKVFGLSVGIADHVDADDDFAIVAPLLAIPLGATCIEKHLTYDRKMKSEDFEAALNKNEFKLMVSNVRKAEKVLIDKGLFEFNNNTEKYRENSRKRVVAARDIKTGEKLEKNMVANKRSDAGMFPPQLDLVYGLTVQNNIKKDQGITLSMFVVQEK